MDLKNLAKMMNDKHLDDLKKMQHKYSKDQVSQLVEALQFLSYKKISLQDFEGNPLVYLPGKIQGISKATKLLLEKAGKTPINGQSALVEEIETTLLIENIFSTKNSIRDLLEGEVPETKEEQSALGIIRGLEFISNLENKITEANLFKLYTISVGDYLEKENKLPSGAYYRDDKVHVVGSKVHHEGLPAAKLPSYMKNFLGFINEEDHIPELAKASIIHFYLNYLHPYFDGNGRTSRLLHLWYLVQQGYSAALYHSLSSYILASKQKYYKAYIKVEENYSISKVIDVTPFIQYIDENVYGQMDNLAGQSKGFEIFEQELKNGNITLKEKELWNFVLFHYGEGEFSTKELEKTFGNAAYATIRGFVLKFESLGLLEVQSYGNRNKYKVKN